MARHHWKSVFYCMDLPWLNKNYNTKYNTFFKFAFFLHRSKKAQNALFALNDHISNSVGYILPATAMKMFNVQIRPFLEFFFIYLFIFLELCS